MLLKLGTTQFVWQFVAVGIKGVFYQYLVVRLTCGAVLLSDLGDCAWNAQGWRGIKDVLIKED